MGINSVAKRFLLSVLMVSLSTSLLAQTSTATASPQSVTQYTTWFLFVSNIKLSKRINIYTDFHNRYIGAFEPMQNQYRIAAEYIVSKKFSFAPIGFAYIRSFIYGKQPATYENNERRIYQQLLYKTKNGRFTFNQRARFEERFIQVHSKNSSDQVIDDGFTNHQFRFRYRGMVTYALNSPEISPGTFSACVYDEIFIRSENTITHNNFDQNRFFAGIGYQFGKNASLQTGFLHQIFTKPNGTQQEYNIGMLTTLTYNFDFSKSD